jgi:AcrR family transcriptional regulator
VGVTEPSPTRYHHGDLRNALAAAALDLAREGGPEAIVLREAARRVGVSPTAAYRHFTALPDLVAAVTSSALRALALAMEAELARCAATGDDVEDGWLRMCAIGRGYVRFAIAEPGLFATAFANHEVVGDLEGATGDSGLTAWQLLERALDDLCALGTLAESDRAAAATSAWASVHGLSMLLLGPLHAMPPDEQRAVIEANLDLVGRGLMVRQ